jgi:hypothetical protein
MESSPKTSSTNGNPEKIREGHFLNMINYICDNPTGNIVLDGRS